MEKRNPWWADSVFCTGTTDRLFFAQVLQTECFLHRYYRPSVFAQVLQTECFLHRYYRPSVFCTGTKKPSVFCTGTKDRVFLHKYYRPSVFAQVLQTECFLHRYYRPSVFCTGTTDRGFFAQVLQTERFLHRYYRPTHLSLHAKIPDPTFGILTYFLTWRYNGYYLMLKGTCAAPQFLAMAVGGKRR